MKLKTPKIVSAKGQNHPPIYLEKIVDKCSNGNIQILDSFEGFRGLSISFVHRRLHSVIFLPFPGNIFPLFTILTYKRTYSSNTTRFTQLDYILVVLCCLSLSPPWFHKEGYRAIFH
ncbi:unnamed protein product [Ilex paraguariensis]|uniref:Uncharacterized protein n=1 Tax=Ilex paraguariensis TaxID=185542 RepID=A0ABC8RB04_9AQUA